MGLYVPLRNHRKLNRKYCRKKKMACMMMMMMMTMEKDGSDQDGHITHQL
jgi:hypothetical protein